MSEENKNVETPAEKTEEKKDESLDSLKAELERLKAENGKLKNAQSNASADAAKYKRELQNRMSEQERAAAETKELIEQLKAENEAMKRNQGVAERNAVFVGMGFSADLAKAAAEASFDGDFASFAKHLTTFITEHDKALKADALRNTPRPVAGGGDPGITKEEFAKMGYSQRVKLFEENPDLYRQLNK